MFVVLYSVYGLNYWVGWDGFEYTVLWNRVLCVSLFFATHSFLRSVPLNFPGSPALTYAFSKGRH